MLRGLSLRTAKEYWQSAAAPIGPVVFLIFVATGVIFIMFAKGLRANDYVAAGVPVLLLISYGLLALLARNIRLRDDQTGDNLYYMGFLFTLTSLAVALYQLVPGAGFDPIVRSFGIAISSTIVGIAGRVLFNQMRQDPIEVEYAARLELGQAARQVRVQLDDLVIALNHFSDSTLQSLRDGHQKLHEDVWVASKQWLSSTSELVQRAVQPIEDAAGKISTSLETFVADVTGNLGKATTQLAENASSIQEATAELGNALAAVNAKISAMQTPDQIIEVKLEPVIDALTAAITELHKQTEAQSSALRGVAEALAENQARQRKSTFGWFRRS